jgi:hypothetical protein
MTSQVLIARGTSVQPFPDDSFACPTELSRETSRASQPKARRRSFANNALKIYKADVRDRLPSFHLSYIRAVTPPNLKQPLREELPCERKLRCPVSGIGAMAGLLFGRRPAIGLIQSGSARAPRRGAGGGGRTSKRVCNDGQAALAVDATAMFMFSVRSGSGAKAEALIAWMRCDPVPKEFG